ncbi:MAG: Unknown protein [uncultured Sulfurovum sp.]|uniref:DUF3108 domain-containing protein n=1 Tax=uncultured Sulfurovum sp. TaxID=269237 RepID=A0A6S6TWW8_9BACT|nr:MAG: Unknown protein [uncultured Sulfurovum sp.]
MLKIIFIFLNFFPILHAKSMTVDYRVEFGVMGKVGQVHTQYSDTKNSYLIDTNLSAVGTLANMVTGNLKERHICKGIMTRLKQRKATTYEMIKSFGEYKSTTLYTINHQKKEVIKSYQKWKKKDNNDKKYVQVSRYTHTLRYYAIDDMITLFLNLNRYIQNKEKPAHYHLKAVGADKKNGRVDIKIPDNEIKKSMAELLGEAKEGEWLMNLIMHRQLYNSKQGELMVRMGKESIIQKAVLKDLIFFGDVRIIKE